MEKKSEIEFDLLELLHYLKTKMWIILLVALVFAGAGYLYSKATTVPQYVASTKMFVYRNEVGMSYNGLQEATQLRRDCEILITGLNVTEEVVKRLNLPMSPEYVSSCISITSEENTRIIQVNYTDTDPRRAAQIVNSIREVASEQIQSIMQVDVVQTVYEANIPTSTITRAPKVNGMLAGLLGIFLCAGVLVVIFLMDDTIRTEEEVERYLGLSTLAAIPASAELENAQPGTNKKISRGVLQPRKK